MLKGIALKRPLLFLCLATEDYRCARLRTFGWREPPWLLLSPDRADWLALLARFARSEAKEKVTPLCTNRCLLGGDPGWLI